MGANVFFSCARVRACLAASVVAAVVSGGCAGYGGGGLRPEQSRMEDVLRTMGEPAMRWSDGDGSVQLAYPRGPQGMLTFMVFLSPDGVLRRVEDVLHEGHFDAVVRGKTDRDTVLRMFGPPREKLDFAARNEQSWEWRYRDQWQQPARFIVIFDRSDWIVRERCRYRIPFPT